MYSEEIDLALRFERAGWESWHVPQAEVIHLGGQSTVQMPDRMFVELWRSRLYLYRKHYPVASRLALSLMLIIAQVGVATTVAIRLALGRITSEDARRDFVRALKVIKLVLAR
jgi:GT2 family glycosyltransferase